MFNRAEFDKEKIENAKKQAGDEKLKELGLKFLFESDKYKYGYQWNWLGMPIIQMPGDIITTQEIIWQTKPDIIIETGIAWGGSIVMYASILELIGNGKIYGIDVVLPQSNINEIMKFPFSKSRIELINGSSIDNDIIDRVAKNIKPNDKVMLILDSNHTHEHVLKELEAWSKYVTKDQYLIVCDTIIEDIPVQDHRKRPWGPGNNPKTAMQEYLKTSDKFIEDQYISNKQLATFSPNGYLKCIKD